MYTGGVLDSPNCFTYLSHCLTAVGYGVTDDGVEYVINKNQWGSAWGEDGYIKIALTEGKGTCGMQADPALWANTN